jgi:hypothetical protein
MMRITSATRCSVSSMIRVFGSTKCSFRISLRASYVTSTMLHINYISILK